MKTRLIKQRQWSDISDFVDGNTNDDDAIIQMLKNDVATLLNALDIACVLISNAGGQKYHASALVSMVERSANQPSSEDSGDGGE